MEEGENRILSNKGLIISPYIDNPDDLPQNSFGMTDDYFSVWQTIENSSQCQISANTARINDGSIGVNLDSFKNLGEFGYIHISTHGDNYYNGLASLWQDVLGPR